MASFNKVFIFIRWIIALAIAYLIMWGPQLLYSPLGLPKSIASAGISISNLVEGKQVSASEWLPILHVAAALIVPILILIIFRKRKQK